jgi:hypothetical protein
MGWLYKPKIKPMHSTAPFAMADPFTGYRNRPGACVSSIDEKGKSKDFLRIDPFGFVSNHTKGDQDRAPSPDTFNIFITGGSTGAGCGATRNETVYASILERKLNTQVPAGYKGTQKRIRVFNAGVPGFNSSQELIAALFELFYFSPSILVMFNGINDNWFIDPPGTKRTTDWHHNYRVMHSTRPGQFFPATQRLITKILESKGLGNTGENTPGYKRVSSSFIDQPERFVGNIKTAAAAAKSRGIGFAHFFQPTTGWGKHVATPEEVRLRKLFHSPSEAEWKTYLDQLESFYGGATKKLSELSLRFQNDEDVVFSDATGIFDSVSEAVYYDPRHYNDRGQELLADHMYQALIAKFAERMYTHV